MIPDNYDDLNSSDTSTSGTYDGAYFIYYKGRWSKLHSCRVEAYIQRTLKRLPKFWEHFLSWDVLKNEKPPDHLYIVRPWRSDKRIIKKLTGYSLVRRRGW